jgi:hypothetical protein
MNKYLIIAGSLSFFASLMHILIIFGGADWYDFFGAGQKMVVLSQNGSWYPSVITFVIAGVLFIWGMYAFSGAGLLRPLPFLIPILVTITSIYLIRGLAVIPIYFFKHEAFSAFWVWSSLVCFLFGLVHFLGLYKLLN